MEIGHINVANGGLQPGTPSPHKAKFKNTHFVDTMILKVLRDVHFSLQEPPKSTDGRCSGTSAKFNKNVRMCRLSFFYSFNFHLAWKFRQDFLNTVFKIKRNLYRPPFPNKIIIPGAPMGHTLRSKLCVKCRLEIKNCEERTEFCG
jgi:hypothetical protein